jgi:hypothetical protein
MYVVTVILYTIPSILIVFGWRRSILCWNLNLVTISHWRDRCLLLSFFTAGIACLSALASDLFWLQSGGDPHGMGSAPGIWRPLSAASCIAVFATLILVLPAKGKGRNLIAGAMGGVVFAQMLVKLLQME